MAQRHLMPSPFPRRKGAAPATQEWLVVPAAGEALVRELERHGIMKMTGLPARDLRVLDPLLSCPSTIISRDRAIVVNLEHIKAIITAAEVLVRDHNNPRIHPFLLQLYARIGLPGASSANGESADGNDETEQGNVPMRAHVGSGGSTHMTPFEFKVLEVCLQHTCRCMESETMALEKEAYPALDALTSKVSTLNLEHVKQIKSRLVELSGRVQKVRVDIEHLLDDDTDMSEMYLARKLLFQGFNESLARVESDMHPSTSHDDRKKEGDHDDKRDIAHESSAKVKPNIQELEMLLEAYFMQVDGTLNKLCHIHDYVEDTEDYVNIMLDEKRNQLLQMGVMITTATVVVNLGIVVTALLTMNIHTDLMKHPKTTEESRIKNIKFWETTWAIVSGCAGIYLLAIYVGKKAKLLQ